MNKKFTASPERRRLHLVAGLCTLGSGLGVAKYLADRSQPPEGDPMPVDFGDLPPGKLLTTDWHGRTVWILRRNAEVVSALADHEDELAEDRKSVV